jgi:hypothetical protein
MIPINQLSRRDSVVVRIPKTVMNDIRLKWSEYPPGMVLTMAYKTNPFIGLEKSLRASVAVRKR